MRRLFALALLTLILFHGAAIVGRLLVPCHCAQGEMCACPDNECRCGPHCSCPCCPGK